MREHIEHYVNVISGIVFMYESVHGSVDPLASHISQKLKQDILDRKPEKYIQSKINYLHKTNRITELKTVMVELS